MYQTSAPAGGGNGKAIGIGFGAMVLGAIIWAIIGAVSKHEFGLVAIGIGILIGLAMYMARPNSPGVAVAAAGFTLVGCALGEILAFAFVLGDVLGIGFGQALKGILQNLGGFFTDGVSGRSYVFWAMGAVAGFGITFRRIQEAKNATPAAGQQQGYGQQLYPQPQQPGPSPSAPPPAPSQPPYAQDPYDPYAPRRPYPPQQ